jgi:hypothetical protein
MVLPDSLPVPNRKWTRIEALAFAGVLLLAAVLRFGWSGVNSFAFDEARLSLISLDMARGGVFATVGMPSSAGVPNLPAAAWVYALPYALSPDPLVATLFTGLLGVVAVALTGWLARAAWGAQAGVAAALFLAASPFAVLYSRSIWAQDLLPLLGIVWAAAAYAAVRRGSAWALALHSFVVGFAFQVHFAGAALALGSLWLLLRFGWWRRWRPVLVGGLLAAAAALPFALEVLAHRPDIVDAFRAASGGAQVDGSAFAWLVQLATGQGWGYMITGQHDAFSQNTLYALLSLVVCGAGGVALLTGLRRRAQAAPLPEITLVLLLSGAVFFTRHSTPVFIHYLLAALPALALSVGALLAWLPGRFLRAVMGLLLIGVCGTAAVWLGQSIALGGRIETPGGLGTPLGISRGAAQTVPEDRPALFFTHGGDPLRDGEAAVFAALWYTRPHRIIGGDSLLILPGEPAALLGTLAPFQAWEELAAAGLAADAQNISRREGEGVLPFVMTLYDGQTAPEGFTLLEPTVTFADGTRLMGWKVRRVGDRLRVSTLWAADAPLPVGTMQQFHHLRDSATLDGEFRLGTDVPLQMGQWRAGDRVIVIADFAAGEVDALQGSLWVDVGHYALENMQRVALTAGDDHVRLGPFNPPPSG